ncbi:hypothetical protein EUTSA_v10022147mg [Eutrema salsugineum]|uniref:Uncharacterized protein n=1 Tax=Eutrema salsugineum TaxID=72664 RepID=V4LZI7_EUTSA|nr:hypothetical protein EUTSA_v10022147mg [Eutrema salsugineum]
MTRLTTKEGEGVYAIASTLMSLRGFVEGLTSPGVDIPVSAFGLGLVTPGDIRKASTLLQTKPQFATVLAFQVEVTPEASKLAEILGVKVICGDSVEHLCQQFNEYIREHQGEAEAESDDETVFPCCVVRVLPNCVFNKEDPILLGAYVVEGLVRVGTPLCIPHRAFMNIGRVAWLEKDQQPVEVAKQGEKVIIKIVAADPKTQQRVMLGREFHVGDFLVSRISRRSIYHFIPS